MEHLKRNIFENMTDQLFTPSDKVEERVIAENILVTDDFFFTLPEEAANQIDAETRARIKGKTITRMLARTIGTRIEVTMEF